jgi:type IV pilus assembly protein PilF
MTVSTLRLRFGLLLLAAGLSCVTPVAGAAGATDLREAARANAQLGLAYLQQGQLALAKEKLERARQQDSRSPDVRTSLAYLYERLELLEKADSEYRQALKLSRGKSEIANTYAVFLCRTGKVDAALKQFDAAARDKLYTTPWAALGNAGVCLRTSGRGPQAIPYFQRALQQRPDYAPAVYELADLQLELGAPGVAGLVADRFLQQGLATPEVLLVAVRAALARDERPVAEQFGRRLQREFPEAPETGQLSQWLTGEAAP